MKSEWKWEWWTLLEENKKGNRKWCKKTIATHVFGIPTTSFRDHLDGNIKSGTYIKKKVPYLWERKETYELGVGHVEHGPINITLTIEIQGYWNNTRKGKPFAHGILKKS